MYDKRSHKKEKTNKMSHTKITPKILYRYECLNDKKLKALQNAYLYLPSAAELNDPYEFISFKNRSNISDEKYIEAFWITKTAQMNVSGCFDNKQIQKIIEPHWPTNESKVEFIKNYIDELTTEILQDIKKNWGILSLIADPNNLLLWSHYADSHKGYCLGFDRDVFYEAYPNEVFYPVTYSDDYPTVNMIYFIENFKTSMKIFWGGSITPDEIMDIFSKSGFFKPMTTKNKIWELEKEWRWIKMNSAGDKVPFPKGFLKRIIFGKKMTDDHKRTIRNVFENNPDQNPEIIEADLSDKKYGVIGVTPLTK